jgi:hypothetical protein
MTVCRLKALNQYKLRSQRELSGNVLSYHVWLAGIDLRAVQFRPHCPQTRYVHLQYNFSIRWRAASVPALNRMKQGYRRDNGRNSLRCRHPCQPRKSPGALQPHFSPVVDDRRLSLARIAQFFPVQQQRPLALPAQFPHDRSRQR